MGIGLILFGAPIGANEVEGQATHHEWVEGHEVALCEDGVYVDSNKGPMWLKVVEYDRENDRYLVEWPCLE